MRLSLSTNWCNRTLETGEEIADKALELGFSELELGFHTTIAQVAGFRNRLDRIPVGSIHAFCPVPISAPQGYPELYSIASFDEEARAMARLQISRNIDFAADMGARTVVLHAGRVSFDTFFNRRLSTGLLREVLFDAGRKVEDKGYCKLLAKARRIRAERGARMRTIVKGELEKLIPLLEKRGVVLALENLPYLEGFPDEGEMALLAKDFAGAPIKAWFDTGHHRVRQMHGWLNQALLAGPVPIDASFIRGLHLNDVVDFNDDHLPPGEGKVDFAALAPLMQQVEHVVVEPASGVPEENLRRAVAVLTTSVV